MATVLVYADRGVDGESLRQLVRSLSELSLRPQRVDAKFLIEQSWEAASRLLIIPGGRDIFYQADLQGKGTDRIRAFVESGGNYLGICAGAYFASGSIAFEKGGPLEVCAERSLHFFPGTAAGPAYGPRKYSYENTSGAEAAAISWRGESCRIYYNGGCTFEEVERYSSIEILSRYLDLPDTPPSILKMEIGLGKAILSGVHFEYSSERLKNGDSKLSQLKPHLERDEEMRKVLFKEIVSSLIS